MSSTTTTTFELVDPNVVVIGDNVRIDPRVDEDKAFVASIKERGVIEPAILYRAEDGNLTVIAGQRRTLAARMAGRPLPALIHDQPPTDADRLVDQYVENEHRAPLSNSERIGAIEQMALAGLSDHQIAKRTATPKATVKAARTAAQAPALREFADVLTLDQAAALADFDEDPEAVEVLIDAAARGRFEHAIQRIRNDRAAAARRAQFAAELAEQGVTIVDRPRDNERAVELDRLTDAVDVQLTVDAHATCPGHAAYITTTWKQRRDLQPGDIVDDEDQPDEDDLPDEDDTDEDPDDSDGSSQTRRRRPVWQPPVGVLTAEWICTDYIAHGHRDRWARLSGQPKKRAEEMTDDEREAARLARRHVIESNKAWKAATEVRRAWITGFAGRKTPPAGAEAYLARVIVGGHGHEWANHEALTLAGFPGRGGAATWTQAQEQGNAAVEAIATAGPRRALQIGLAIAVAMWEEHTGPDTWRTHTDHDLDTLAALKQWGYTTSEIEDQMLAARRQDS